MTVLVMNASRIDSQRGSFFWSCHCERSEATVIASETKQSSLKQGQKKLAPYSLR